MNRPSLRQLEYLVALADHLHFGQAAKACGVTQPALSVQIQQLEELVGAQLIERTPKQILLTSAGESMAAGARRLLRELDDLTSVVRSAGKPLTGPRRLGIIPTLAPYLLPHLLPLVRERHPQTRLILREDQTHNLVRQLREGRLDLLLLALPVEGADFEELPLFTESFVLAMPKAHPLLKNRKVRQKQLADQEVLLLEDGHCLRDQALEVCHAAGARESTEVQATSLSTLVQMVAGGMGVTLLPASSVPAEVRGRDVLEVRAFEDPTPHRSIGLLWRKSSGRAPDYRILGELLRSGGSAIEGIDPVEAPRRPPATR